MFNVLARTYFRATGIPPSRYHRATDRSWYGDDLGPKTDQKRFSDCGCVKRDGDLSVRGHGSLRGRALRLMMVFGGGSSPMWVAG